MGFSPSVSLDSVLASVVSEEPSHVILVFAPLQVGEVLCSLAASGIFPLSCFSAL